jgi:membrane protein
MVTVLRRKGPQDLFSVLQGAINLWLERNAFQHAGALAFYTLFSLAPLVIIVVAIVGAVFGEEAARGQLSREMQNWIGVRSAEAVEEAVRQSSMQEAGILPTLLGVGALLFGATTVFAQMQASLNAFWGVQARPSRSGIATFVKTRLLSLGLVLIIGFLMLTSFLMSMAIVALMRFAEYWIPIPPIVMAGIDLLLSLFVATAIFAMIFKILPDVVLEWKDVMRAGVTTAVLFVGGQYLISFYLTTMAPASTYGAAASLVLVLFWVYYSSLILFLGTSISKETILRDGQEVQPKKTAVRVVMEVLEGTHDRNLKKVAQVE